MKKLLIKIRQFFVPVAFLFIAASFSGAYYSDSVSVTNNSFTAGTWSVTPTSTPSPAHVVLNEIMVNPEGSSEQNSEWVELYNTGGSAIDINGWYLYDFDDHPLEITSSNVAGGSTIIGPSGYLVVLRNGDADFSLNNGGDVIRLLNGVTGSGELKDTYTYGNSSVEEQTWARIPDGSGVFSYGHEPTPGGPNV